MCTLPNQALSVPSTQGIGIRYTRSKAATHPTRRLETEGQETPPEQIEATGEGLNESMLTQTSRRIC